MGFKDWIRKDMEKSALMKYHYELGCQVLGEPEGGWWRSTLSDRLLRIEEGRREALRREA